MPSKKEISCLSQVLRCLSSLFRRKSRKTAGAATKPWGPRPIQEPSQVSPPQARPCWPVTVLKRSYLPNRTRILEIPHDHKGIKVEMQRRGCRNFQKHSRTTAVERLSWKILTSWDETTRKADLRNDTNTHVRVASAVPTTGTQHRSGNHENEMARLVAPVILALGKLRQEAAKFKKTWAV